MGSQEINRILPCRLPRKLCVIAPERTMPRKSLGERTAQDVSLDHYGIYRVERLGTEPCPESLQETFDLVHDSKILQMADFNARREQEDRRGIFDTDAAHDYDVRLKQRASDLSDRCNTSRMKDAPESTWVNLLLSRVFLPFDLDEEERLDTNRPFHHWYAARSLLPTLLMLSKSCLSAELPTGEPTNNHYFKHVKISSNASSYTSTWRIMPSGF